jgi:hypothetical protein
MWQSRYRQRGRWLGARSAAAAFALLAAVLFVAGCDDGASRDERDFDAESLNAGLAQELAILDVYRRGQPLMRGRMRPAWRKFRAQEQEYVDGLTKSLRGLGREAVAEPAELDFSEIKTQKDFLTLAYEMENAAIDFYVDASPKLHTASPRILAASLAVGHGQHLVVLRQGLGADLAETVPEAFESGEVPPPGVEEPAGSG